MKTKMSQLQQVRRSKLKIIKKIDEIRVEQLGQIASYYDLIVDTLSEEQLSYYLGLTEEEAFYNVKGV